MQVVKGKVVRPNTELWDKSDPANPRVYNSNKGVMDIVVTPTVFSWVSQGLIVLNDDKPAVAETPEVIKEPEMTAEPEPEPEAEAEEAPVHKRKTIKRR